MASTSMSIMLPAALPSHLDSPFDSAPVMASFGGSHKRKQSRNPKPPPLPAFTFDPGASPKKQSEDEPPASPPHHILEEMATRQEPQRPSRPTPLPAFSFNPGATVEAEISRSPSPTHPILEEMAQNRSRRSARPANLTDLNLGRRSVELQPSPSPTKANFGDASSVAKNAGHRRRGSEFVGGGSDGSHLTSPTMVSTSPSKADFVRSPGPPVSSSGPGRHRHRRSEAVSISGIDASDLIKANAVAKHRAGSAPSTPSEIVEAPFFAADNGPRTSPPASGPTNRSVASSPRLRRESAPGGRPRVGFSDTVDFIPRPLSMISSETDGSTSTIRGTHSLTGSINSFAAVSPPAQSPPTFVLGNEDGSPRRRPNTADAATPSPSSFAKSNTPSGEDLIVPRPASASGSPGLSLGSASPSSKKKHFWFSHSNDSSPKTTPLVEKADPISALPFFAPASPSPIVRPKTSPERSASIKKRKVRTWTGHLFSRKGRLPSAKAKGRRTPTPPLLARRVSDHTIDFDPDETIVLRNSPSPDQQNIALKKCGVSCVTDSGPSPTYRNEPDDTVTSPILDLDAALGPFGSEEKLINSENMPRGAHSRILRLHSSERRAPMDAFGTFHRRAESAPQMAPINRTAFGVHHVGSSTSIADDVFDEEEEDDFLANEKTPGEMGGAIPDSPPPANLVGQDNAQSVQSEQQPAQHQESSVQRIEINNGLGIAVGHDPADAVAIVDTEEALEARAARSSDSTLTAPVLSEADLPKRPASSPMEFLYGASQTSYASSTEGPTAPNSAISSPDAEHISFDHQPRLNRYAGEQNLDMVLRSSNDDLPSLTDSVSTGVIPRFSSSAGTRSSTEHRAVSLSGPTQPKSGQAWKRASLASLNRLIPGSANGSKLRFEETAAPTEAEKATKKSNRMSRLMHFWRSKEKGEK